MKATHHTQYLASVLILLACAFAAGSAHAASVDPKTLLQGTPTPPQSTPKNMIDDPIDQNSSFDIPTLEEQSGQTAGKGIPQMRGSITNTNNALKAAQRDDAAQRTTSREQAKQINLLLIKKGLLKQAPFGAEMYRVGAPGTESNAVLQQVQEAVGLYPDETSLPDGDSGKINAGKPTPLTMTAINALPDGDGTNYTQADIDAAKQAIQQKQTEMNAATAANNAAAAAAGQMVVQPATPAN